VIAIIFEDNDVIAVNKPENLASIPTRVPGEETVLSQLSPRFACKLFVVHRLDKEVSGVMLFAKNADSHKRLNAQFFSRSIQKTYVLLAHGLIAQERGIIDKPIRQFGSGRMGVDLTCGKESKTEYMVTQRSQAYSLVTAFPQTGRRHQIRVHFYSIGHPIAGDMRYGDKKPNDSVPRLMLHAASITFKLSSGETKSVEAPIPESMTTFFTDAGFPAPIDQK